MAISKIKSDSIDSLDASKITTGTIANARVPASAVTQHVTGYSDVSIRSDILKLAIHQAIDGNRAAYNLDNSFIDTFEDDTGITTETTVDRNATGEYVSSITGVVGTPAYITGDRQSTITVSTTLTLDAGAGNSGTQGLVNGIAASSNNSLIFSAQTTAGKEIKFDFLAGNSVKITEAKYYETSNTPAQGVWKWQGSADDTTYTDIGSSFTLAGAEVQTQTSLSGNTSNYRYYRLFGVSGSTSASGWNTEVEFKMGALVDTTNATGTLISDAQTASTSRTSASGVIIYEDGVGTNTLGTNLKIYFTANNGTNWTEATSYGTATTYSGTKKLVKLGSTTVTGGTQVAMKAEWANQSATISAAAGKTVTSFNSPVHSTTEFKVGATSLDLTSTKGLEIADDPDWATTGDSTIEMWVYSSSTPNWSPFIVQAGTGGMAIGYFNGDVRAYVPSAATLVTALANNTWFHVALCLDGTTARLYMNGVQMASATGGTQYPDVTGPIALGRAQGGWNGEYNGYLDEIRISNVCRYLNGTTFTSFGQGGGTISSPTPFTRDANTTLLIHSDTTNGSTTFEDSSGAAEVIGKEARLHGWAVNY